MTRRIRAIRRQLVVRLVLIFHDANGTVKHDVDGRTERNATMAASTIGAYGSWKSPVTSDLIAGGSVRLAHVTLDRGNLYWLESRPNEGGRSVLVRRTPDGAVEDVTAKG